MANILFITKGYVPSKQSTPFRKEKKKQPINLKLLQKP